MNPPVIQTYLPSAVLWDMDGTLVDTEPYWIATEYAMAEKYGGTWSHAHAMNLVGSALLDSGDYIRVHMGIDRTPQQIVDELLDGVVARVQDDVPWRPGARELLDDLRAHGVPCALVTMSWQRFVDPILAQLPEGTFATVVTGDRVELGKPHPEPYLTAAAELGLAADDCVAIEDSNTGATSAAAAGCAVLCVPHHVPILEGERRYFADTLSGMDSVALARLVAGEEPGAGAGEVSSDT
ncbi:MAG TPA: HAD family phosphatase [Nocardioides sp.]|nr:HAD family phosphatase [Nocardioides sp.]